MNYDEALEKIINAKTPQSAAARWLGDAPPLSADANGWWWLEARGEWVIALVKFAEEMPWHCAHLRVTFMLSTGAVSGATIDPHDKELWGGRLLPPGASPNVVFSDGEPPTL